MKEEPRKTLFNDEIIRAAKPILFNGEMVRAIIEGRKTVTRRVIKTHINLSTYNDALYFTAPYKPGDILYVRETWAKTPYGYIFRADGEEYAGRKPGDKWHPSIHMPKEAARLFLRVKYVYVARLQDSFAKESAILYFQAEGMEIPEDPCLECIEQYGEPCCSDLDTSLPFDESDGTDSEKGSECGWLDEVRDDFSRLWDSTVKPKELAKYGWAANPWVWGIEFELIQNCGECEFFKYNMSPDGYLPEGMDEFWCKKWEKSCDPADLACTWKGGTNK